MEFVEHDGETFFQKSIVLDGQAFQNCRFIDCQIVITGERPFAIRGQNRFENTTLAFRGAALQTMKLWHDLYHGVFAETVEAIFDRIRRAGTFEQMTRDGRGDLASPTE